VANRATAAAKRLTVIQCPSVSYGVSTLAHEPCTCCDVWWKDGRCTAAESVPRGGERKVLACPLSSRCRWAIQGGGFCPPMTHGELCEHQGGTFNAFHFEDDPSYPADEASA
jgi:hypothetical protein